MITSSKQPLPLILIKSALLLFFLLTAISASLEAADNLESGKRDLVTQMDNTRFKKPISETDRSEPAPQDEPEDIETLPAGPEFQITKIILDAAAQPFANEFQTILSRYEGRTGTMNDLLACAKELTGIYRKHHLTTTRVYVPEQRIENGQIILRVLEGVMGDLTVEGNRWFNKKLYSRAVNLKSGDPFDLASLETSIHRINSKPDRVVQAYLEPGDTLGKTDIVFKTREKRPLHLSYEFNRRGSELTHYFRHSVHLTHNNLLGLDDPLAVKFTTSGDDALNSAAGIYELPLGSFRFSLAGGYSRSRLQKNLKEFKVRGESFSIIPGVRHRLYASPQGRFETEWFSNFEIKNSRTAIDGNTFSDDRMRVAVNGVNISENDRMGRTFISSEVRTGIPKFLGGSKFNDPSASRLESGGGFVYGNGYAFRQQRFLWGSYFLLQGGGQLSGQPLTALEQFYLGGMHSVRGYPENDSGGDSGMRFSAELDIPAFFIPSSWKIPNLRQKSLKEISVLTAFIDGGKVFNEVRQTPAGEKDRTLLGAGFGARMYVTPDMNLEFALGFPFGDESIDKDNPQVHLSCRVGF